jgi:hypothetical protein
VPEDYREVKMEYFCPEGLEKTPHWMIIKKSHQFDCYNRFINEALRPGFEMNQQPYIVLDFDELVHTLEKVLRTYPVRAVFNVNGTAMLVTVDDMNIWEKYDIPLVVYFAESPIYHFAITLQRIQNAIFIFQEAQNTDLYRHFFNTAGINGSLNGLYVAHPHLPLTPFKERAYPLVFTGNHVNVHNIVNNNLNVMPAPLPQIMWQVIDKNKFETTHDSWPDFITAFQEYGLDYRELKPPDLMRVMLHTDSYIRQFRRALVLNAIKQFPLTIVGYGWEGGMIQHSDNKTFITENYPDTITLMNNSRMCLNVLHNVRGSAHDRIASTLERGAVSVTDTNPYILEHFTHGQDMVQFNFENLDTLDERLHAFNADTECLAAIAEAGRAKLDEVFSLKQFMFDLEAHVDAFYAKRNRLDALKTLFAPECLAQ